MKTNSTENCTHPVPPNDYGVFAMHSYDNKPLSEESLGQLLSKGPIAKGRDALKRELAKVDDEGSLASHD